MRFMVKLIEVTDTRDHRARENLNENSTHVINNLWLYEGCEIGLDDGIEFDVIGESAIESYGDLTGHEIIEMVEKEYRINKNLLATTTESEIIEKIHDIISDTIEIEYQQAPCGCCEGSNVISGESEKLAATKIYEEIIKVRKS